MKNARILIATIVLNVCFFAGNIAHAQTHKQEKKQRTESNTQQSAGTATGILKIDGKPLQLKYAYAMSQPNTFHEERNDVALLLTSTPLPPGALQGKEACARPWMGAFQNR